MNSHRTLDQSKWQNKVRLGRHNDSGSYKGRALNGKMSEVRFWHTARTRDEIRATMNNRLWNLDERFFHGNMAEVRIWTDVRSQTEIRTNMQRRLTGYENNLRGYWKLDGTAADFQTNNPANPLVKHKGDWSVKNNLEIFDDDETLTLTFDGADDYLDCGANLNPTDALTVEAWIKHAATSGNGHIVNCGGGWDDDGYSLLHYNGNIRVELQNTATGHKTTCDNIAPADDEWNHIAFSWQKTTGIIALYIT